MSRGVIALNFYTSAENEPYRAAMGGLAESFTGLAYPAVRSGNAPGDRRGLLVAGIPAPKTKFAAAP
jgi:hypothetical protein